MNSEQKNTFYMKDVLVNIPQEQLMAAFPLEGNRAMYPKECFNPFKCVQGMTKKLKIQTKVPVINFVDQNLLYKNGIGCNYIYYRIDGKVVMTYDASMILSYITQYDFKPQILDKTSQIKTHLKMIDWSLNNQLKQQEQDLKQQEQTLYQQQLLQQMQQQQVQSQQVQPQYMPQQQMQPQQMQSQQVQSQYMPQQQMPQQQVQPQQMQSQQQLQQQPQQQQDFAFNVVQTTTTKRASAKSKQPQVNPIAVSEDLQIALQPQQYQQQQVQQQQVSQPQETETESECGQDLLDNVAACISQPVDMDNLDFNAL